MPGNPGTVQTSHQPAQLQTPARSQVRYGRRTSPPENGIPYAKRAAETWNDVVVKRVRKGVQTMPLSAAFPVSLDRSEMFARDVQATRPELGRFAYLLVGNSAAADDLLAEAYARAWPHYRRGEIDNLGGYLRRSIANLANGRLRRVRLERREMATRRIDWRAPRTEAPEGGFEQRVDSQDQLWRAIWSLPPNQRVVVVLRHAEDRSEEETADLLGISLGTVKSRLARGLATLREKLEHQEHRAAQQAGHRTDQDEGRRGR